MNDLTYVRAFHDSGSDILGGMSAAELRRHISALESFSASVLSHLHLESVLQGLVDSLKAILEVDSTCVFLWDATPDSPVRRAYSGANPPPSQEGVCRIWEATAGTGIGRRRPVAIDELSSIEAGRCIPGLASMMLAPLFHEADLIGLIGAGTREPRRFSDPELYLFQVITERAAPAIVNARIHNQTCERLLEEERVEQALAESEARYRLLAETAADAIITIDPQSRIVTANPAAGSVFGYEVDELIGKSLEELMPERFRAAHAAGMRRYLATGERRLPWRGMELSGLHRDGHEILLEVAFAEHISGDQHLFTGTMRDITVRKRTERVLAAEYATSRVLAATRDVVEAMPTLLGGIAEAVDWDAASFWSWDPVAQALTPVDFWTRETLPAAPFRAASRELLLEPGVGLPGKVWRERLPVWIEDLSSVPELPRLSAVSALGIRSAFAFPVCIGADCLGVMEFFNSEQSPRDDVLLQAMDSLGSDIGQFIRRRQAEIRAEESEELQRYFAQISSRLSAVALDYELTLETLARLTVPRLADWGVVDVRNTDGSLTRRGIAHADPAMADIATRLAQLPIPQDPESSIVRVMETGEPILIPTIDEQRLLQLGRDEEEREILRSLGLVSAMIVPLSARNRVLGSITFLTTVGRRRYNEGDVANAVEFARRAGNAVDNASLYREMAEANRAKAEFLATVSHELRTPLNAIVGYADLLGMGVLTEDPQRGAQYVGRIAIAARHLAELIEEVLAFSRLESGREVVSPVESELGELLEEIRVIAEPLAQEKGIQLTVQLPAQPIRVFTDARKLRQVLLNVVGNAIKFTEQGGVTVESSTVGESFLVRVTDTGIGIQAEHLDRIFEPFWQVDQGTTRNVGGTGLGLTVTRRFIDLLGGTLEVYSSPGQGTTISIRLPLRLS